MTTLTIDNQQLKVSEDLTVMQAAATAGIMIPAMCYLHGHSNHPSCMICLVKDLQTGKLVSSCALPVADGMNISTNAPEVKEARKEALELLLSDHVGDCEAPCRLTCPAFINIPLMNRLIAGNRLQEALSVVREEIALPLILGYICPAPCEKACRRKQVDETVSICLLKRITAFDEAHRNSNLQVPETKSGKKVAIIGSGAAGLAAAFYTLRFGHDCTIFDKNEKAGGAMRYNIPDSELPKVMLDAEIEVIARMGAMFRMNFNITIENFKEIQNQFDAVFIATGNISKQTIEEFGLATEANGIKINKNTFETSQTGIFACGNIVRQQQMAVRAVAQGKETAVSANSFLKGEKPQGTKPRFNSTFGKLLDSEFDEYLKESSQKDKKEPLAGFVGGFTVEEAINEAKRCMHCDCRKLDNCKLRNYSDEYNADRKRFLGPERKPLTKAIQHEAVVYEPEKCIRCGLCVEITQRDGESLGLTYVRRGFDVRIQVPFGQTMKEALLTTANACVTACPTGALAFKL